MNSFNSYTLFQINEINQKYKDKKIAFTCSTFDLMHVGHILMLQDCKNVADILVVGLQTDPTIDRPEKSKPIQDYNDRLIQISSCKYVDEVIQYSSEQDLKDILKALNPYVRVLSHEWEKKSYTGRDLMIDIHYYNQYYEKNTDNLIKQIYESEKKKEEIKINKERYYYDKLSQ